MTSTYPVYSTVQEVACSMYAGDMYNQKHIVEILFFILH